MRMLKKVMTGMSVAAAALVVAGGVNAANADAAATISVDAAKQTMTVSGSGSAKEVWVSWDAVKLVKKGTDKIETLNPKAKWDIYDGTTAVVDLSSKKFTKDVYITVKDDSSDLPNVYKFTADGRALKGKYGMDTEAEQAADKKKSTIVFTGEKDASKKVVSVDPKDRTLEYRTAYGSWATYNPETFLATSGADTIAMYEKQGATLYFRYKAASEVTVPATAEDPNKGEDDATFKIANVDSSKFAGTEVKVKIGKEAAAPTATIDYDNGAFKIKKATEYRLIVEGSYATPNGKDFEETEKTGAWVAGSDTAAISVPVDVEKSGVFEVRTAASEKKVASKISVYPYTAVTAPSVASLEVKDIKEKSGKLTATIENSDTDNAYLIYDKDPVANSDAKLLATVKKATIKSDKVVNAKATVKNLTDGTQLYVRSASDKAKQKFRSKTATKLGTELVAPTPAPTAAPTEAPTATPTASAE